MKNRTKNRKYGVFFLSTGYGFGLLSETETEPISWLTAHHYFKEIFLRAYNLKNKFSIPLFVYIGYLWSLMIINVQQAAFELSKDSMHTNIYLYIYILSEVK